MLFLLFGLHKNRNFVNNSYMQKSATVKSEKSEIYFQTAISNDAALTCDMDDKAHEQERDAEGEDAKHD